VSIITEVAVIPFTFEVEDLSLGAHRAMGVSNMRYERGGRLQAMRYAVEITADDGARGRYVTHWVGTGAALGQTVMLAPTLLGRDPEHREVIYDDLKRELRAYDHMGHGPLDIALWDLVGRRWGVSVARLLGAYKSRLPTYASTLHGQTDGGGLDSIEAFASFAVECREQGFPGFKIHGWHEGDKRKEAAVVLGVRAAVGDAMEIMVDPGCELRTFMDALYVGRACDEAACFWYEDPYRDSSVSVRGQQMLREKLKTPLLVSEHVRGLEQKAAFAIAGACDMIHTDPEYDLGITGTMKIAHMAEALGMDIQVHACGPAHRACVAAIRNTHFYELALIGPGMRNVVPPIYTCGYDDQLTGVGPDGCVPVPTAPGLGVNYDWDFILAHKQVEHRFRLWRGGSRTRLSARRGTSMSEKTIIARTRADGTLVEVLPDGRERPSNDWRRLDAMTDEEVHAAALADPDAQPMTEEQLARVRRVSPVKRLRWALRLTQEEFAARYQIPLGTLRDWEQGRAEPDQPARAYLKAIAGDAEAVHRGLQAAPARSRREPPPA
jgi:L-alanine-DL-glutamate epimerase-like enolase superfamily enzyme/DNA-binding transcriptional regulator YiaG